MFTGLILVATGKREKKSVLKDALVAPVIFVVPMMILSAHRGMYTGMIPVIIEKIKKRSVVLRDVRMENVVTLTPPINVLITMYTGMIPVLQEKIKKKSVVFVNVLMVNAFAQQCKSTVKVQRKSNY